jgi:DNA invertase Pin-like site-specific DNA recombinase
MTVAPETARMKPMTVGIYVRTSTAQQTVENQLLELREYVAARGWHAVEYSDVISGATDRRPGLDALLKDARRRKFKSVVVWSLDRAGRSLPHLVTLLDELQSLGVSFISLREGLDLTTAAGKLQLHILAALASFERERLRERVLCGLSRARGDGTRLGRQPYDLTGDQLATVAHLSVREAAKVLGVSYSVISRRRTLLQKPGLDAATFAPKNPRKRVGRETTSSVA